ncbi:MAG: DUF2867 domain-containing protein [Halioglobus sp.]|nr:DUF2867 domain-containing protein [Halioglobus sp.]
MATALVFGASGYIGSNLVPHLWRSGWKVRACARNLDVLEARAWPGAELAQADALVPESLPPVMRGIDVAFYLVHSMAAGPGFDRIDLRAAENFAAAAAAAGIRRVVYLGGLVPGLQAGTHIDSRRETGDVLRRGAVPVTEIRAGIIIGPGSAAFEVMRDLVLNLPVMITPRWVRTESPPIALHDLLVYLERIALVEEAAGEIYDAGGPETCTYQDMMRHIAHAVGRRPPLILPVPLLTPTLSSYWLGLTTAVPTNIARALIGGLHHNFRADDAALRALVPRELLGVRDAIDAAFAAERDHTLAARWCEGAFDARDFRHDVAFYAKRASGSATSTASPGALWRQVTAIGGDNRYYYMNALWTLREVIDWCVGGPGLGRGRRHPQELRLGDAIDHWTVIALVPERRLTLHFGMRAPGSGVLEFDIQPLADQETRVIVTAYWHPQGVWGLLYWWALVPVHRFIFRGLAAAIARRAEAAGLQHAGDDPPAARHITGD